MARTITRLILVLALFAGASQAGAASDPVGEQEGLLQFTSDDGHILAFGTGSVYVTARDHMLQIDLVSARDVFPTRDEGTSSGAEDFPAPTPSFTRIAYPEAWPGVTVVYEGNQGTILKSSYHIRAHVQEDAVKQIRLRYNRPVHLDAQGNLIITYDAGQMTEAAPIAWQDHDEKRRTVEVSYRLLSEREVGFCLGDFDPEAPLVIDPALTWSTFLGGTGSDWGNSIALDGSGNVYVAGRSNATWGSPVRPYTAADDAYVAKLDSDGTLLWNTFVGGSGIDYSFGIAVDAAGNAVLTGYSIATWGSPVRAYNALVDVFVAKLDSDGNLTWNTFLGGGSNDYGRGIAMDGSGNVSVIGESDATWGSPVRAHTSGNDAFVALLASNGSLSWSTFLGSGGADFGNDIIEDGSGNLYVCGRSALTWGAPVRAFASGNDGFVARLASNGSLTWNTFLGGSGTFDSGQRIAVDGSGNIVVAGYSNATWGSPLRAYTSGMDALVAGLASDGSLTWNTFLGGSGSDYGYGIAIGGGGDVYVEGISNAAWGSPWRAYTADYDVSVAKLANDGSLTWNTFLGGAGYDSGNDITTDGSGHAYVVGHTDASWGTPIRPFTADHDAFAVKLEDVTTFTLSGRVFEDADFAGTATDYDGGVMDLALQNVDVELYDADSGDAYLASDITDAAGDFSFTGLAAGNYKLRVRSSTIGDADTPPMNGLNATVPVTWPYPLPEMTWGHGAASYGGQDPDVDDTVTLDNAGPGDTHVNVTISTADISGVNIGFCYNLIISEDDDANPDNIRSKQGTLRQFIKNANAIVGVDHSQFRIPGL